MSTKRTTPRPEEAEPEEPAGGAEPDPMVIRVRRGALRRFDQLKRKSAGLPVEIKWDRRTSARRAKPDGRSSERRGKERRQPPPFTWETADFVVVGDSSGETGPEATPGRQNRKR
jgi:hypothetical protein